MKYIKYFVVIGLLLTFGCAGTVALINGNESGFHAIVQLAIALEIIWLFTHLLFAMIGTPIVIVGWILINLLPFPLDLAAGVLCLVVLVVIKVCVFPRRTQ